MLQKLQNCKVITHFSNCAVGKVPWLMLPGIMTRGGGWQSETDEVGQASLLRTTTGALQWTLWLRRRGNSRALPRLTWARPSFLQRLPATWGLGSMPRGKRRTSPAMCMENGAVGWSPVTDPWHGAGRGTDDGDGSEPSPSPQLSTLRTRIMLYASISTDHAQQASEI